MQWITQIRRYTRGAPLILVGTKTDSRVGASLWAPLYPDLETRVTATEVRVFPHLNTITTFFHRVGSNAI